LRPNRSKMSAVAREGAKAMPTFSTTRR
jgi:hypothetical protein